MSCTLYSFPLAFNPQKALMACEEKNLISDGIVTVKLMGLFNGESLSPSFMNVNPNSTVPTLVIKHALLVPQTPLYRSEVLNQTSDILEYIDFLGGEPIGGGAVDRALAAELVETLHAWDGNLFALANLPRGARKVLEVLELYRTRVAQAQLERAEAAGRIGLAQKYRAKLASMASAAAEGRDGAAIQRNRQELEKLLDRAERLLEKSGFLAGPAFSMADVVMAAIIFRIETFGQADAYLRPRPRLGRYFSERIRPRPSYAKVMGAASSKLRQVALMLPGLVSAVVAGVTGRY